MCYKGHAKNKMRYKGFKMKLRTLHSVHSLPMLSALCSTSMYRYLV